MLQKFSFSTAELDGLEEREDHGMSLDGQMVDMAGIVTEVKGKATKKGAYMAFVTLEDLTGQMECLVFPKVYERYQGMMAVDDLVVITGRLSIREDEAPKLLMEKLVPLQKWDEKKAAVSEKRASYSAKPARKAAETAAPQPHRQPAEPELTDAQLATRAAQKLYLRISRADMDKATAALGLHPGSTPVYMHLPEEKITLLAPRISWCDASESCMKRMKGIFGEENVKLVCK